MVAEPYALNPPEITLEIRNLGLTRYSDVWIDQKKIHESLMGGTGQETLIICEHQPVITLGRSAKEENLLVPHEDLSKSGVEVFHVERGGDITYHGPGQMVAYPLLDLKLRKQDVGWYMRTLEETVINTLSEFGLESFRVSGKTGVWVSSRLNNDVAKICAIGVRLSRWCTLHGLSLNVGDCSHGFSLINPCGFKDITVTSMEQEGVPADLVGVARIFQNKFLELFG